jgi:hypothetical protein
VILALDAYFLYNLFGQLIGEHSPGIRPVSNKTYLIPTAVLLFITLLFLIFRPETEIKSDGIYVRFFPFHLRFRKYDWNNIARSFVRQYSPLSEYGGWGIRFGMRSGRALNTSGNKGIQLIFRNNSKLLIGTNKPDEARNALKEAGHLTD